MPVNYNALVFDDWYEWEILQFSDAAWPPAADAVPHGRVDALVGLRRAIDSLQRVVPDIILLDAVMPGIDGFETCQRIKQMASAQHVPVIFMTGLTETEHVLKAFQSGGVDYVAKPIKPMEVLARIATHVQGARERRQARNALDAFGHARLGGIGTLLAERIRRDTPCDARAVIIGHAQRVDG